MLRSSKLFLAILVTVTAAVTACEQPSPTSLLAVSSEADLSSHGDAGVAPEPVEFTATLPGLDPCTGSSQEITYTVTRWIFELPNGNELIRWEWEISTSLGYEGHGKQLRVTNGRIVKAHFNDMLTHPDGRKYRDQAVGVIDLKTSTVRVFREEGPICVRQ